MARVMIKYMVEVSEVTRTQENNIDTKASNLLELIDELEHLHPGFKRVVVDDTTGQIRSRIQVFLTRRGQVCVPARNMDTPVNDMDTWAFW